MTDKDTGSSVVRRSRGLERAFAILEFLSQARRPMRPNEIASAMKAPRSTIYELVNILLNLQVLELSGSEGRVFLGRKLVTFSAAYAETSDFLQQATASLARLAEETSETAQLCFLDGKKYTVALMREGSRPFRISSNVGERTSIPWTASGRLLLDHLSDKQIIDFIPASDFQLPSGEWLPQAEFLRQVRQATRDGHFTFDSIVDSFTHCFAVPVRGKDGVASATLCLVAPKEDAIRNKQHYLHSLKAEAARLRAHVSDADLHRSSPDARGRHVSTLKAIAARAQMA